MEIFALSLKQGGERGGRAVSGHSTSGSSKKAVVDVEWYIDSHGARECDREQMGRTGGGNRDHND